MKRIRGCAPKMHVGFQGQKLSAGFAGGVITSIMALWGLGAGQALAQPTCFGLMERLEPGDSRDIPEADSLAGSGSLALAGDGRTLVIAARSTSPATTQVRVYAKSDSSARWALQSVLRPSSGLTDFASRMAISFDGSTLLMRAAVADPAAPGGMRRIGVVYSRLAGVFVEQARIEGDPGQPGFIGDAAIASDGRTIVLGRPSAANPPVPGSGAVLVYRWDASLASATLMRELVATSADTSLGTVLAISDDGSTIAAGTPSTLTATGASGEGRVHVFAREATDWSASSLAVLVPTNSMASDRFGASVAVSGDGQTLIAALVTPIFSATDAHVFVRSGTGWIRDGVIPRSGRVRFAPTSLALSGDGMTASLWNFEADNADHVLRGALEVYRRVGGTWSMVAQRPSFDRTQGLWPTTASTRMDRAGTTAVAHFGGSFLSGEAIELLDRGAGVGWTPGERLRPSDAVAGGRFGGDSAGGISIDVRFSNAVIGAPSVGPSGAAYVYSFQSSSRTTRTRLVPTSPLPPGARFGSSVAIAGSSVLVGADADGAGAVYVFGPQSGTWVQTGRLTATGIGVSSFNVGGFGRSIVAIDSSPVFVGAPLTDWGGFIDSGAVFVFNGAGGDVREIITSGTIGSTADRTGDQFGSSLSVNNNTLVVGAPFEDGVTSGGVAVSDAGAAYVFTPLPSFYTLRARLARPALSSAHAGELFGSSVALIQNIGTGAGSTVLVGAPNGRGGSGIASGVVSAFSGSGSQWLAQATMEPPTPASGDRFGASLGLAYSTSNIAAVIGSPGADVGSLPDAGRAYLFERAGTAWSLTQPVASPDPQAGAEFGNSIRCSGNSLSSDPAIFIGEWQADTPSGPDVGVVYAFGAAATSTAAATGVLQRLCRINTSTSETASSGDAAFVAQRTGRSTSTVWQWRRPGEATWQSMHDALFSSFDPRRMFPPPPGTSMVLRSVDSAAFRAVRGQAGRYEVRMVVRSICGSSATEPMTLIVCTADFDCSAEVTIDDVALYLSAWFANDPSADTDGSRALTLDDLFGFIRDWFASCP